ncbi:hypothetical protein [Dysgonomonas sp. 25]|uniref:hypothetical protein n=1 Tax=Dysgonomonas sp. 25 TaxID=2302933 RepID=UPI0013D7D049|nr:hypothetical protein [Dysgonomonas sp. 25]NDV70001.1 hypothetical protein [Dysgonomonas sp. 25]
MTSIQFGTYTPPQEEVVKEEKGGVRIVLNLDGGSDIYDSAKTRKAEIEEKYPKDKLIYITDGNLGNLKKIVESEVKKAQKEGYGKTYEFSVFGHCGSANGPVGNYDEANTLDLFQETGDPFDKGQLQKKAWKDINFNFDKDASVAAFYGCNSLPWAETFLSLQPMVLHSGGLAGGAGGSYSTKEFDQTILNVWGSKVYLRTVADGKILPVYYYTRGEYDEGGDYLKEKETWENLTIKK